LTSIGSAEGPKRAIIYLRQSTYREESISLELQEHACREYCERMGYRVVAVESDPGISGRTWIKRPKVQQVLTMIETDKADVIVLWKWSRLSRNRAHWAVAADRVDVAGGRIESATEPLDTATASGRFARGVMTEYAAFQSEQIGEQWRETHARRRRNGLPADGAPRYGYDKLDDGSYALNAAEGAVVAEMYRRYLRGEGFTRIVQWLNSSGHQTKAGSEWSRVTVTHLLDAGFGAGKIIHRGAKKDGSRDWRISAATFYEGAQEPVISSAEWDAYVARRLEAPLPPRVVEPKYPLTGLIFCGDCGAPMHVGNQGLKDYKCSRATQRRDVPGMYMTRALVERRVREWVGELAQDVDELAAAVAKERERRVIQLDNIAALDRRIADVTDRLGRITVRWAAGNMPDSAYDAAVAQLDADLAALKERRQRAAPTPRVEIDPQRLAMNLDADWEHLTVLEQRTLLRALVARVEIHKPSRQGVGVWRERVRVVPAWSTLVG
jgi:site-specific DNA recombinase